MDLRSHRGSLNIEVLAEALVYGTPVVKDFKYLGSKAIKVRKSIAWRALNSMTRVWKSNLTWDTKHHFFEATMESVLLY